MSALETFRTIAPEFKEMKDDEIAKWIKLAEPFVSKKKFGKLYEQAVAYLAAHKLKMGGFGDTSNGTVGDSLRFSSVSEGGSSVSFATPTSLMDNDAEYTLTTYGVAFLNIRRSKIVSIVTSARKA